VSKSNIHTLLRKLILNSTGNSRLWAALAAVCVGTTLLLVSVAIWWNFKELMEGKRDNDSLGSTFLTISKQVTNENMGQPMATIFNTAEIDALRNAPEVQDAGVLSGNRFPVYATFGSSMGFATELFLEAVPERFMDNKPANWQWQPGDSRVPIIISTEFLNLYNYGFALSQGLPQLSESSIQSIAFELKVGRGLQAQNYTAQIVGFSDRISSVLVPESFIDYGNNAYAPGVQAAPSRVIVKAKDPSADAFVHYLQAHNYTTNAEQLRWNKLRSVVTLVTGATGLLAALLMGIGILVFILFIELTIAKAQPAIQLLTELGYSPGYLSRFIAARFIPLMGGALVVALLLTVGLQLAASIWGTNLQLNLGKLPGWPVWAAWVFSLVLFYVLIKRATAVALRRPL
jgi:hypothetical protein